MIIGILGATGVGKSDTAIALAKAIDGEIVSLDSMQIYRHMNIGTAKVSVEQMQGIPHHMIDIVDPSSSFSTFQYVEMAREVLQSIQQRSKQAIFVGGTGLYMSALIYGLDYTTNQDTQAVRQDMMQLYQSQGIEALVRHLYMLDSKAIDIIDCNNPRRVIRAIEIASTGDSVANKKQRQLLIDNQLFVLNRNRAELYSRINRRVDTMIDSGLIEETKKVLQMVDGDYSVQSLQAIGYKELIQHILGHTSLEECVDNIKQNSRRYAKRQISYFKRLDAHWIDIDELTTQQTVDNIINTLNNC